MNALSHSLRNQAKAFDAVYDTLRDDEAQYELSRAIRNAGEITLVLARLVEGKSLHEAFGAPGDWGYDTPLGQALYQHYANDSGAALAKAAAA